MRLDIVTLFPGICAGPLRESIVGRAQERGLVDIHYTSPRDFAHDRHGTVDDTPYGGGAGMVLKPEPLFAAVEHVLTGCVCGSPEPTGAAIPTGDSEAIGAPDARGAGVRPL